MNLMRLRLVSDLHCNWRHAEPHRVNGGDMSFGLYIVGFLVLIVGLAWGAYLAHVLQQWIGVGVVVLLGLGIVTAVTHTRQRDSD